MVEDGVPEVEITVDPGTEGKTRFSRLGLPVTLPRHRQLPRGLWSVPGVGTVSRYIPQELFGLFIELS